VAAADSQLITLPLGGQRYRARGIYAPGTAEPSVPGLTARTDRSGDRADQARSIRPALRLWE